MPIYSHSTNKLHSLAAAVAAITLSSSSLAAPPQWVEGQILVKGRAGLPDHVLYNILDKSQGRAREKIGSLDVHIVHVPPQAEDKVVSALSRNPHIEFAEKDMLYEQAMIAPDDTYFGSAWHLTKIQAPTAWSTTQGNGVTVAILDAGVASNHPDLQGKLVPGWNTASNNSDTSPVSDHGTKAAGVVAALSNNGIGVTAIAYQAKLMPIRITDATNASASAIASGLNWAADNGARVANISYTGMDANATIRTAAQYMRNKGGLVVNAGGNTGGDYGFADNTAMIAVSATTSSDTKASWSSYGSHIDVAAPGAGIWTTTGTSGYGAVSGTSFASPTTAAVVALIMAANPDLSPDEVEATLEQTADNIGSQSYFGSGRINAAAAVQLAMNTTAGGDTQAPSVTITSPTSGSSVSDLASIDVSASDDRGVASVTLYANGQMVGTDNAAPYRFSWDSTSSSATAAEFIAYATDAANNEGASAPVRVTIASTTEPLPTTPALDVTAPSVAFLSPAAGANLSRTAQVSISASDDVGVTQVELYIDGRHRATAYAETISYSWNTRKESSGSHSFRAVARDASGKQTETTISVSIGGSTEDTPKTNKGRKNR